MVHAESVKRAYNLFLSRDSQAWSVRDKIIVFTDAKNSTATFFECGRSGYPSVYGDGFFIVKGQVMDTSNVTPEVAHGTFMSYLSLPENTSLISLTLGSPSDSNGPNDVRLEHPEDLEKILKWWRWTLNAQGFDATQPLDHGD